MFDTVLIANRGEIAVRVAKTLRRMGIRSVAVYSDADARARHVRVADEAIRIGPAAARESYLSIPHILAAARASGADAVHPGYGFLSENAAFAGACADAGLAFIGPPASAIEAMGDKIRAKQTVAAAGVPVVPGRTESGMSDAAIAAAAGEVGYPVLLKPSAGGGGKGMRLVTEPDAIGGAIESARREASAAFGDDTLLVERFVVNPRHIEIQVLADAHGTVRHLGERECSLQRRHQKIVEECPSPLLLAVPDGERIRERMGSAAVEAARACGYVGAGTVEFIVSTDAPDEFYFMEMNTRLQVEHPVTEMVAGIDLVEQQVRVAAGETLTLHDFRPRGHAIEARIYAEDPDHGFLPTGGTVLALREPESRLRVDSGIAAGAEISSDYDPMLAKYVAYGADRAESLRTLRAGLTEAVVLGVPTNIPFLSRLLADPDVVAGDIDTGLVERKTEALTGAEVPQHVLVAAAMERALALEGRGVDPWDLPGGWRVGQAAVASWQMAVGGGDPVTVSVSGRAAAAMVSISDGEPVAATAVWDGEDLVVRQGGRVRRYAWARAGSILWLTEGGGTWAVSEQSRLEAARRDVAAGGSGEIVSPMPGTVLVVKVAKGEVVTAGQPVAVVEAMKMEHTVTAGIDGRVRKLPVRAGQQVALGQVLALITAEE
ncbi:MAG: acetyl/propionyl/methylcrotonyl-CoA carboxylase subunit alpha [Sciscionella sp.]